MCEASLGNTVTSSSLSRSYAAASLYSQRFSRCRECSRCVTHLAGTLGAHEPLPCGCCAASSLLVRPQMPLRKLVHALSQRDAASWQVLAELQVALFKGLVDLGGGEVPYGCEGIGVEEETLSRWRRLVDISTFQEIVRRFVLLQRSSSPLFSPCVGLGNPLFASNDSLRARQIHNTSLVRGEVQTAVSPLVLWALNAWRLVDHQ